MKRGITIEYLKCRADLNFEVDIGVNGAFGTSVTKWPWAPNSAKFRGGCRFDKGGVTIFF